MNDKQTTKWLLSRAKGQLWQIVLLAVMRCTLTVLGVVFALTSRFVIDAAVAKDLAALTSSAAKLLTIIALQIGIKLIGQSIEISITAKLNMNIRSHLFASILKSDFSAQSAYHSGDLLTRLANDTSIISGGIISLVPSVLALCVGLVYVDTASSGEHWGTAFAFSNGFVDQNEKDQNNPMVEERKAFGIYDYWYTPDYDGDIHSNRDYAPDDVKVLIDYARGEMEQTQGMNMDGM